MSEPLYSITNLTARQVELLRVLVKTGAYTHRAVQRELTGTDLCAMAIEELLEHNLALPIEQSRPAPADQEGSFASTVREWKHRLGNRLEEGEFPCPWCDATRPTLRAVATHASTTHWPEMTEEEAAGLTAYFEG